MIGWQHDWCLRLQRGEAATRGRNAAGSVDDLEERQAVRHARLELVVVGKGSGTRGRQLLEHANLFLHAIEAQAGRGLAY